MKTSILILALAAMAGGAVQAKDISVADFGAKPVAGTDNFEALQKAIAACKETGAPTRLVFPKGRYEFSDALVPNNRRVFDFTGLKDLTVDGNGSELIFSGKVTAFTFDKCTNVGVKNLSIDWARVPFSQGKVLEAHDLTFDVEVDKEYPVDAKTTIAGLMDYDPETRLPIGNLDVFGSAVASTELIRPQVLRITLSLKTANNKEVAAHILKSVPNLPGKLMVLRHEVYGNYGVDFMSSTNCSLENVNIYSVPGMGIHGGVCKDISLKNVGVRIKPGSGRLMSTTADCQYYTFCSGTISIQDSYFEGMGDDGLNITQKYRTVRKILGPASLEAFFSGRGWVGTTPAPGDVLEFSDQRTLVPHATATVKSAKFDLATKSFTIEFTAPLPAAVVENDFITSQAHLAKGRISNCTFRGMRARGAVFSTRDLVVENCKFQGPVHVGIFLKGGSGHGVEGPVNQGVVIRNNTFEGCGGAAIYAYAAVPWAGVGGQRDIVIEGNTIRDDPRMSAMRIKGSYANLPYWDSAIVLSSTANALVTRNTIGPGFSPAIFVELASNVKVINNQFAPDSTAVVNEIKSTNVSVEGNPNLKLDTDAKPYFSRLKYLNDLR